MATPSLATGSAWVLGAFGLLLFAWYDLDVAPGAGLDYSWHAALHMAAHGELTFGSELVFTYGPLGFLSAPEFWYSDTGFLALAYTAAFRLALGVVLFLAARRTYGTVGGFLTAVVVASALGGETAVAAVVFVTLMLVLQRDRSDRVSLLVAAGAGAVAGVEMLVKLSIGVELVALALIFVLSLPSKRLLHIGLAGSTLAVALLAGWAATGQDWGALPEYASHGASIVSGYASAMASEHDNLRWQYPAALLVFAVGFVGVAQATAAGTVRQRVALLALWTVFSFLSFKQAFVRHDAGHAVLYFEPLLAGFLAVRWPPGRRSLGLVLTLLVFAVAIAAKSEGAFGTLGSVIDPVRHARAAVDDLSVLFSAGDRKEAEHFGRFRTILGAGVDRKTVAMLEGHSVHVLPQETTVVWAYRLRWAPLPVFQSYSAYTHELDELNRSTVDSRRAPDRLLMQNIDAIDGRFLAFDDPAAMRAILCRYVEMRATDKWMVLRRGANRCGPPEIIRSVRADWGEPVSVPSPANRRAMVYVRVAGVGPAGLEKVRALLFKPVMREIMLDGTRYRLVPGTAGSGLIMRTPEGADFTGPFRLAPHASRIAVLRRGSGGSGGQPLRFDFYAASISSAEPTPAPASARRRRWAMQVPARGRPVGRSQGGGSRRG
jgi:hypothetical protein